MTVNLADLAAQFRTLAGAEGLRPFAPEAFAAWCLAPPGPDVGPLGATRRQAAAGFVLSFIPAHERGPLARVLAWPSSDDAAALSLASTLMVDKDRDVATAHILATQLRAVRARAAAAALLGACADLGALLRVLRVEVFGAAEGGGLRVRCARCRNQVCAVRVVQGEIRSECPCGWRAGVLDLIRTQRLNGAGDEYALFRETLSLAVALGRP